MGKDTRNVPLYAARLIIGHLQNKLNEKEQDELDDWLTESETNEEIFVELTDGMDDQVFSPEQLIIDTEEAIELWIIAGLLIRHFRGLNNEIEEKYLQEWSQISERNKEILEKMKDPRFMQQLLQWAVMHRNIHLN